LWRDANKKKRSHFSEYCIWGSLTSAKGPTRRGGGRGASCRIGVYASFPKTQDQAGVPVVRGSGQEKKRAGQKGLPVRGEERVRGETPKRHGIVHRALSRLGEAPIPRGSKSVWKIYLGVPARPNTLFFREVGHGYLLFDEREEKLRNRSTQRAPRNESPGVASLTNNRKIERSDQFHGNGLAT